MRDSRIILMADVHGNLPALTAVLEHIDGRGTPGAIYCLGDLITIGPDTDTVLNLLFARPDVGLIAGNHDELVVRLSRGGSVPAAQAGDGYGEHARWVAARTNARNVQRLAVLPRVAVARHGGWHMLLTHYHLRPADRDAPLGDGPWLSLGQDWSAERLDALYDAWEAAEGARLEAAAFGHSHRRELRKSARRLYVNPGALGCGPELSASYAELIFSTAGGAPEAVFHAVPYDNRGLLAAYHELEIPAAEFILQTFHGGQSP